MEQPNQFTTPPQSIVAPYGGYHHMQYAARPQLPPPPPIPPFPPQPRCYSDQFQFRPSRSSSPPPPYQCMVPPQSDHYPPNAYHGQPFSATTFHASPPLPPPFCHAFTPGGTHLSQGPIPNLSSSQNPQHYPQINQDLCNSNLVHHQGWGYHGSHNNEEDWATRARAWASSKSVAENQHLQTQFQMMGRFNDNRQYHGNYSQPDEHHFPDFQQSSGPASSYQQSIAPPTTQYNMIPSHLQELSSYVPDMNLQYTNRDAALFGESSANIIHPDISTRHASVYQQEVPSSYSSVTGGGDEAMNHRESLYKQNSPHVSSDLSSLNPLCRPPFEENPSFANSGYPSPTPTDDISKQHSNFVPTMTQINGHHMQSGYIHSDPGCPIQVIDHVPTAATVQNWPPTIAAGISYSSICPQVDPSMAMPSSVSGHPLSLFQRTPESNIQVQPPVPSANPTFGFGPGSALFPATGFSVDGYGATGFPERPKKGSMPNWLREEIIKNKAVIASSTEEQKEEMPSVDHGPWNGGQGYSKSFDSSRSSEDDDDEDYVEATRIAAVNKEIKRILTEVLLKVTDELFAEIATRVINEDNSVPEVGNGYVAQNGKYGQSSSFPSKPHNSSSVLVPAKVQKVMTETMDLGHNISNSLEDVLGLASYASDDEALGGDKSDSNGKNITTHVSSATPSVVHVVDDIMKDDKQKRHPLVDVNEKGVSDTTQLVPNCNFHGQKTRSSEGDENHKLAAETRRGGDKNGSREISKEGTVHEAIHNDDTRMKLFHAGCKENEKESDRVKRNDQTNNVDRTKEKREKNVPESSKRGRNYSIASRGKNSREDSVVGYSNDSSDDASDTLKRKMHSRRSPSPYHIRSRRRQISRSPNNSRKNQRRHSSPYSSSHKPTRARVNRNMSPVHRRRR